MLLNRIAKLCCLGVLAATVASSGRAEQLSSQLPLQANPTPETLSLIHI